MTYPHLLAFGLHMAIMTDGSFPFPAIGTVHLENSITPHRPICRDERLQVTARPADLRAAPQGPGLRHGHRTCTRAGELVWEETTHVPARSAAATATAPRAGRRPRAPSPAGGRPWRLPGDLGRRYAAVSGDHNPIHLYALTAKAFGFPRQIAHGMWSKARCLAALDGRLPDAVTVEVAFKKPVLLPGTVAFGSARAGDGYAFALQPPEGRRRRTCSDGSPRRPTSDTSRDRAPGRAAGPGCGSPAAQAPHGVAHGGAGGPGRRHPQRELRGGRVPDAEVGTPVAVPVAGHRHARGRAQRHRGGGACTAPGPGAEREVPVRAV